MEESILKLHDKTTLKNIALGKGLSRRGFNGRNMSRMRKQDFIDFILYQDQIQGEHELDTNNGLLLPSFEDDMISIFQELIMDDSLQPIIHILDVIQGVENVHFLNLSRRQSKEDKTKPQERIPMEEDEAIPDFILKDLIKQEKVCDPDCACETCQENKKTIEDNLKVKTNLQDLETKITCVICRSNMRNVIFNPCNHLATCITCSKNRLLGDKCPLCRKVFENTTRIFC